MTWTAVLGFSLAVLPLVITPGASFTLATSRILRGQQRAGAWVVAGTATGIYCHALLAAAGLSAAVMHSAQAFRIIRVLGGVYLVSLGTITLWRSWHCLPSRSARRLPWVGRHAYPQAVVANVLNPKAAAVYLTLAPQFLSADHVGAGSLLVLATAHVAAMALWLLMWSVVLTRSRRVTGSKLFKDTVDRIGGTVLVYLGVRTASDS